MNNTAKQAKRRSRKQIERQQQNQHDLRERQILRKLLEELRIADLEKELKLVDQLMERRQPAPRVRAAADGRQTSVTEAILKKLRNFLTQERWQPPGMSKNYTTAEFFSLVVPTVQALTELKPNRRDFVGTRIAGKLSKHATELIRGNTLSDFEAWMSFKIRKILISFGRMDRHLYFLQQAANLQGDLKDGLVMELHEIRPERKQFWLNGEPRWALRCGQPCHGPGIEWATWDLDLLGLPGSVRQLPVYVQPHVFGRLYGIDGRLQSLSDQEALLHDLVYKSLQDPKMHPIIGQPGHYLVEYACGDCKLGYLVCEILPEAVIARTFLFLTMDGTPEGDALYRRLKVNRHDKSFLGLDSLGDMIASDLQTDPIIRRILQECQVGHLFDHLQYHGSRKIGAAAECRRYLKLRSPDNNLLSNGHHRSTPAQNLTPATFLSIPAAVGDMVKRNPK